MELFELTNQYLMMVVRLMISILFTWSRGQVPGQIAAPGNLSP